nr:NYN domain-containing protein [Myxococcota bacterium]
DIPQTKMSGKNSADIHMVVDALDLCFMKPHIDVFALISGDSDFSPLVGKLKESDKRVIACGVKSSTSDLLVSASDEFIYYDDLVREKAPARTASGRKKAQPTAKEPKLAEGLSRVLEIVASLDRDYDQVWGSMIKQTVRRVFPGFNENYYGYGSFAEMLEELEDQKLVELDYDEKRGNYLVRTRTARSS